MMRYLLFSLTILFASCVNQYDGEKRLIVEGLVVDNSGNPLSGKHVSAVVGQDLSAETISSGNTDSNGKCVLSFPAPKNSSSNFITINVGSNDAAYRSLAYIGLNIGDFSDFKFAFQSVLYGKNQLTELTLQLYPVAENHEITILNLNAEKFEPQIFYHPLDYVFNNRDYIVKKNQTATLEYDVFVYESDGTSILTHHTDEIVIGESPVVYPLIY